MTCKRKDCCCKCKYLLELFDSDLPPNSYPLMFACIIPHAVNEKVYAAYFKFSKHGSCEMFEKREEGKCIKKGRRNEK